MDIRIVNSSSTAMQQQYPVERRESQSSLDRTASAPIRSSTDQEVVGHGVQNRNELAESVNRSEQTARQSPPKPVVNAQGQKTGTIISTTA